ncbi:hypothetical protein [Paenibacillus sp. OAE614]|uniref:hypothetical protein n=1 Tax=Paenibacillus sp. OAE614 TaxID=2663804 RepID=UPI001789F7C4
MKATPKYELLVDVSKPVEEIAEFISLMLQLHPGQKLEILEQVDEQVGMALSDLEVQQKTEKNET